MIFLLLAFLTGYGGSLALAQNSYRKSNAVRTLKNRMLSFFAFALLCLIPGAASKSDELVIAGVYSALFFLGGSIGSISGYIKINRHRKLWFSELRIGDRVFVKVADRKSIAEGNIGKFDKDNATVFVEQEPQRNEKNEVVFVDKIPVEVPMKNVFPTQTFANDQPQFTPLWR